MRVSTDITQGTLPFESNQSLMGEPVEYHHNLRSYFWLIYLITCNCASPFNMCRDWSQEIARDQTRQRITPTLITNLAEIKTRGDWKQVVEDHALDSEDRSARLMSNFTISTRLQYIHSHNFIHRDLNPSNVSVGVADVAKHVVGNSPSLGRYS